MKDILIVGFGLAGLSIAKHAEDKKLSFDIICDNSQKSSKVAGGLLNPIAVKRMKPVWKVEEFLPFATSYYHTVEVTVGARFYYDINIKVKIHSVEQENNWFESFDKPRVQPYISKQIKKNDSSCINAKSLGTIRGAYVDLKHLFNTSIQYHIGKNNWLGETFDYSQIKILDHHIDYKNKSYKHVIFCEGYGVSKNPFFDDLGIYGNKGDYLIIESKQLKFDDILKAKYFLIPLGNDLYKFGATYQREPLNHIPSETAKVQMQEALNKMINIPYRIVDQVCGIRPTTRDRKPILGTHKNYKNLHILNGFGSRGVMTSPLLGKNLIEHIFEDIALDKEVAIDRIYARI